MQTAAYQESTRIQVNDHGESLKHSILKILAYFDVFHYPLLKSEITQFLDQRVIEHALDKMLLVLEQEKIIFRLDQFYSLRPDPLLEQMRKKGNQRAGALLAKGTRIGRFLFQFPGVRAIAISGSLSKNHAPEKADIDFFIITSPNRLWIARTFMHLFKKLTFLTGSHHFYCMNYYIDQLALEVPDKNIYNAIEIKTLMPVCGKKAMDDFVHLNGWTEQFLPACALRDQIQSDPPPTWIKKLVEWIFSNKAGDQLDNWLMKITARRWKRKEVRGKRNYKGRVMGLQTGKHFAWSNPESFREKVLQLYNQKLEELKLK